jgi:hypothetical protein
MAEQSKLDVSKWQAAARQWNYTPVLQFFVRFIQVALIDANCDLVIFPQSRGVLQAMPAPGAKPTARPTDAALLARDWIARSEPGSASKRRFRSFVECCDRLGIDADKERITLLNAIDMAGDFDNDEAWARLDELSARGLQDDAEPLFDAPRCVPAMDQLALFAMQ